jgi:hypothetical protein
VVSARPCRKRWAARRQTGETRITGCFFPLRKEDDGGVGPGSARGLAIGPLLPCSSRTPVTPIELLRQRAPTSKVAAASGAHRHPRCATCCTGRWPARVAAARPGPRGVSAIRRYGSSVRLSPAEDESPTGVGGDTAPVQQPTTALAVRPSPRRWLGGQSATWHVVCENWPAPAASSPPWAPSQAPHGTAAQAAGSLPRVFPTTASSHACFQAFHPTRRRAGPRGARRAVDRPQREGWEAIRTGGHIA